MDIWKLFVSPWEAVGFFTSLVCIFLNARAHVLAFPFALICVSCYAVVFYEAKLYADMGLQLVYFILSIIGAVHWLKGNKGGIITPKSFSSHWQWIPYITAIAFIAIILGFTMKTFTDNEIPFLDAFATSCSLVAQHLLNTKFIQNWIVWIAVDVVYVGMFLYKNLYATALLYFVITLLAVYGYWHWSKKLNAKS